MVAKLLRKRFERIRWGPQTPTKPGFKLSPRSLSLSLSPLTSPSPSPSDFSLSLQILMGDEVMGAKKGSTADHKSEILLGQVDPLWLSLFSAWLLGKNLLALCSSNMRVQLNEWMGGE